MPKAIEAKQNPHAPDGVRHRQVQRPGLLVAGDRLRPGRDGEDGEQPFSSWWLVEQGPGAGDRPDLGADHDWSARGPQ